MKSGDLLKGCFITGRLRCGYLREFRLSIGAANSFMTMYVIEVAKIIAHVSLELVFLLCSVS